MNKVTRINISLDFKTINSLGKYKLLFSSNSNYQSNTRTTWNQVSQNNYGEGFINLITRVSISVS